MLNLLNPSLINLLLSFIITPSSKTFSISGDKERRLPDLPWLIFNFQFIIFVPFIPFIAASADSSFSKVTNALSFRLVYGVAKKPHD